MPGEKLKTTSKSNAYHSVSTVAQENENNNR